MTGSPVRPQAAASGILERPHIFVLRQGSLLSEEEYDFLLELAAPDKRRRIRSFKRRGQAEQSLLADGLARFAVGEAAGLAPADVRFVQEPGGKPVCEGLDGIHFNVSHSGNMIVCSLDRLPVGIDIEPARGKLPGNEELVWSEAELALWRSMAEEERRIRFAARWTMLESVAKMSGKGMTLPIPSLEWTVDGDGAFRTTAPMTGGVWTTVHVHTFILETDYAGALCTLHSRPPLIGEPMGEVQLLRALAGSRENKGRDQDVCAWG